MEGPSVYLLTERCQHLVGSQVISVNGNTKADQKRLLNREVIAIQSWGKHFLICFSDFIVRIHFLMFGSYRINEERDLPVRLGINFSTVTLNFYTCSVKILEGDVALHYDFTADVMNEEWDPKKARQKIMARPDELVCDALLDQDIFSGVGNIIKNEVLYRIRIHPESVVGKIPSVKIKKLIEESRNYSFEFMEWRKNLELKKHLLAYSKKTCLRCNLPFIRKHTGRRNRRSFFCIKCQRIY